MYGNVIGPAANRSVRQSRESEQEQPAVEAGDMAPFPEL